MKRIITTLMTVGVIAITVFLYLSNQPTIIKRPLPMPKSGRITVEHAAPLFAEGLPSDYTVVDVRTVEEYQKRSTRGTVNIPVAIFEDSDEPCKEIISRLPKDKKIIFVCPYGPRSKEMYQTLTDPVEDLGCGLEKDGLYNLWANVKYKKDRIIVRKKD